MKLSAAHRFRSILETIIAPLALTSVWLIAGLFAVDRGQSIASDAKLFHYPELQHFLKNPVGFASSPGLSGPIPGYHWFLASIARLFGKTTLDQALPLVQVVHFLIALVGAVAVTMLIRRLARTFALALPIILFIVLDFYYLQAAYYLNTEAPTYTLLILIAARLAIDGTSGEAAIGNQAGALGLGLVLVRHAAFPALLGSALYLAAERRWSALGPFAIYASMAALVITIYALFWGGLVSPYWQAPRLLSAERVSFGIFPHSLAHVFALAGIFAPFFLIALWDRLQGAWHRHTYRIVLAVFLVIVVGLWFFADTNADWEEQRTYSIVWKLAALGADVQKKSIIVLSLMLITTPLVALIVDEMISARRCFVEFAVFGSLLAAQIIQNLSFQRYVEVPLFVILGAFAARFTSENVCSLLALYSLAVLWGFLSITRFYGIM